MLEARLGAALSALPARSAGPVAGGEATESRATTPSAPVADVEPRTGGATTPTAGDDAASTEVDEAAESAFLAEARERGEVVSPRAAAEEPVDDAPPRSLPPLDDLVNRIPAEVRDTLEDLFRARFTTVKRFPRKALKS